MNIKLIIIFFTIILLFVYLYLRKQEKKNKIPYINKLKSVIENFTEECQNSNTKIILDLDLKKIENFRKSFFFDIYPDLDTFTFKNLKFHNYDDSLDVEKNFRYYLSKEIKRSNREPLIDKDKIVFGPSGLVFDTRRDDIIVFDISKLRRFQVRMDRTLTDNLPNFKLTIKEVYSQEEIDRFLLFQMINAILDNKNVFQNELLTDLVKKTFDENEIQIPFIIEENETNNLKKENNLVQKYFKECIEKLENLDKVGISVIKGLGERINNNNNKEIYIDKEFYNDKDKLINDLTEYKNSYEKFYYKKMICISDPNTEHCKIKYQNDVPLYDMGKQGKGVHKINFDFNDTTLQHTYILDDRMNPNNNSWLSQRHKGYFSPYISYINDSNILEATNTDFYSNTDIQGEVTGNKVDEKNVSGALDEAFKSFNSGYPIIRKKDGKTFSIFNLPDEYDMTGIGMCMNYESNNSLIFVPDIMNNRIQVFGCNDNNFIYKGEFGNLPFTNSRSLPTYQGEGNDDDKFLLGATTNYEPIVNTESSTTTAGYKCNLRGCGTGVGNCLSKYLENGPFDYESTYSQDIRTGKRLDEVTDSKTDITPKFYNPKNRNKSEDIMECKNQFSKRRANIHGRQVITENGNEEKVYAGHFYHLLSEYYSVLSSEAKKSLNYYNPHLIGLKFQITNSRGNKTETIDDGVTGASIAYRKFLLKVIKATDDGQAFGQLLRPKSIAYDDEDRKYYVVDTYHHCIQCYQENLDDDGLLSNTVGGENIPFECVDRKEGLDNNLNHYLYDETFEEPNNSRIKKYNRSRMYSLGVRQKILHDRSNSIYNDRKAQPYLNEDWGVKYCQSIDNQAVVKLFRWVSGNTVFSNNNYKDIESPALYTELCRKSKQEIEELEVEERIKNQIKYSCPGTGEFLYPTDIVITENPFKNEKLMMVTDMGNNRVSIFKKYNIGGEKRFRFFRFLGESENIINPISITVSVTGKVFVLQGNFMDTDGQKILIFYPKIENLNGKKYIKYTKIKEIKLNLEGKLENIRAVKIRIDDRGMIAVCDANNNSIHIVGEHLQNTENLIKFEKKDTEITGSTFNIKPTVDYYLNNEFGKNLDNLPNFNRFRFVLIRKNLSTFKISDSDKIELFISREYYKNPKELQANPDNKLFNNREIKYIIEDKYSDNLFENYWSIFNYFKNNNISTDLINFNNRKIVTSSKIDFDYIKNISKLNIFGHSNTVIDGVYDWNGETLLPNCTYKYLYGFYNNLDLVEINNQNNDLITEITTFPLHISKEDIVRRNIVSRNKNCLEFKINYGNISPIHRKTIEFNPIYLQILRTSHNRSKDVNNKYLNCIKGEMIQIIVPSESKSFYNLQSKPKYGKLYYYNVYKPGNVRMQDTLMKERVLYDNSKYLLFYSAEGGFIGDGGVPNIPSSEEINNDFIDDFFILGDTPETNYKQLKFRVRIKVSRTSDKIIILDKPNELRNRLNNYSKNPGEMDQYSTRLIQQIPLYEEDDDGNYEYPDVKKYYDKGTFNFRIEPNRTYEYTVMVSNHKVLNPACSTFFVTTRPEKPYIYKKGAEFVELDYNGQKRKYLKIVWFCPKDEGIYWPYNFFIIRKQIKKKQIQKPEVVRVELHIDENPKFIKSGKSIIINPSIKNEDIPEEGLEFLFNQDLGSLKDWKVTFQPFNNKGEDKEITINNNRFIWNDLKRSYEFNGRSLTFSLKLKKDEYLQNVKIEETVILPSSPEISSLKSEIDTEYKQKDNQQKKELKKKFENYKVQDELEERQKLIALYEEYRKNQKLGFAFTLQDDYQGDIETSKEFYKGYSGDLYNYLKVLNKEQLLKIFDELNDKIAKNYGDVTMRLDGPSGMLRSGGIDMLIDKIRYLSYKLRENQKERNKIIPFGRKCQEVSIKDLMSDASLKTSKKCIDKEYELRKKEKDKEKEKQEKFLTEKLKNEKNSKKLEIDKEKQRLNRLKLQLKEENNKIKKENEEILGKIQGKEEQIKKLLEEEKLAEKKLKQQLEKAESEMGDKTKLREAFLLDTVTLPEQKVLTDITKQFMIMNKNLKLGSIERGYNYLGEFVLIPYDEREVLDVKETFEVLKDEGKTKLDINWDKPEDLLEVLLDSIKFGLNDTEFKQSYDEVKFMTLDFATNTVKFIKEVEYSESDSNIVPDPNIVILTKQTPEKSKEEIEEAEVNNTNLIDELRKQIEELKNSLKSGKILTESGDRTIKLTDKQIENDVDVLRLEDQVLQLQNIVDKKETEMSLCEWSFVKSKEGDSKFKSEFSFSQPINRETKDKILQEYAISPDLVSLGNKKNFIRGEDIFDNPSLSKEDKEKEYIGYKQLIEVGRNSKGYKFDYKVGIFQTGYSFRNKAIRNYLGVDLTTNDYLDEKLPILNLGENYSDTFSAGDIIVNEKQEVIPDKEPVLPIKSLPQEEDKPRILFFEPKEGYQNTVVKIVGTKLDELDYICFRDIKVKVLRKGKRVLKNMIDFDFRNSNDKDSDFITNNNIIKLKEDKEQSILNKTIDLGKNYKFYRLNINYKLLEGEQEKTIKIKYNILNTEGKEEIIEHEHLWTPENTFFDFKLEDGTKNKINRIEITIDSVNQGEEFGPIQINELREDSDKVDDMLIYDEYLVKPPTLKELNKECWQSLERYKVLVWGFYKKLGLQIRSSEGKISEGKSQDKLLTYTYMDRIECPENERLQMPNKS